MPALMYPSSRLTRPSNTSCDVLTPLRGTFSYSNTRGGDCSRAMAGAGILALAHATFPNHDGQASTLPMRASLTTTAVPPYLMNTHDRYHYGLFLGCQGL